MKSVSEIREFLDEQREDIYDCMTMPCDREEQWLNERMLEAINILLDTHDNLLISTIKQYASRQRDYESYDYEGLWRWINA